MKLISWNVNGWRAIVRKGSWAEAEKRIVADIWCLQEIKTAEMELPMETGAEFVASCSCAEKKGYSGTMILVRKSLMKEEEVVLWSNKMEAEDWMEAGGIDGAATEDLADWKLLLAEGRMCAAAFDRRKMLLLNVYFPNGGMSEERLKYKMNFYAAFLRQSEKLKRKWPKIIVCGDVNTAHEEIDLARPKENSKVSGFLPMEREWVSEFLAAGWIDTFRFFYPEKERAYSWWDYKTRARERNVGWRIDYFLVTKNMQDELKKAAILDEVMGSDHAPIGLEIG